MANQITGIDFLPSSYAPETKTVTIIMHPEDRPNWCGDVVALMDKDFSPSRLHDRAHFDAHLLLSGPKEILKQYAVHKKDRPKSEGIGRLLEPVGAKLRALAKPRREESAPASRDPNDAFFALVFLDSPLLRTVTLIDPPGFSAGIAEDSSRAHWLAGASDIVLFQSRLAGFLDAKDFGMLAEIIRTLPVFGRADHPEANSLCNLFIVATHADKTTPERKTVLDIGAERLWLQFDHPSGNLFQTRADLVQDRVTSAVLRTRFFPYWSNWPETRKPLETALLHLLDGVLPQPFLDRAHDGVRSVLSTARDHYRHRLSEIAKGVANVELRKRAYDEALRNLPAFELWLNSSRTGMRSLLGGEAAHALQAGATIAERFLNEDHLHDLIKSRFDDNRDEAQKEALSYITEMLRGELEADSKPRAERIRRGMTRVATELQDQLSMLDPAVDAKRIDLMEDRGAWLAVGAVVGGGLGVYLGLLTTAWIFGPIGAAIGAGLVGLMIMIKTLRWRRTLASELASKLRADGLVKKVEETVRQFWDSIESTIDETFNRIGDEQDALLRRLKTEAGKTSAEALQDMERERMFVTARMEDLTSLEADLK